MFYTISLVVQKRLLTLSFPTEGRNSYYVSARHFPLRSCRSDSEVYEEIISPLANFGKYARNAAGVFSFYDYFILLFFKSTGRAYFRQSNRSNKGRL